MPSAGPAVDAEAPAGLVPTPRPSAQSFSLTSSFQRGRARGRGRRVRGAPSADLPGGDSARRGSRRAATTLPSADGAGRGSDTSEPAGQGLPEPRSGARRRPPPAAAGRPPLRAGVGALAPATREGSGFPRGSPVPGPCRLRGARSPGCASPAAAGLLAAAAPDEPPRRRLSRRRRACAPHERTASPPPPPPQPGSHRDSAQAPPPSGPRPPTTPTARAHGPPRPRRRSQAAGLQSEGGSAGPPRGRERDRTPSHAPSLQWPAPCTPTSHRHQRSRALGWRGEWGGPWGGGASGARSLAASEGSPVAHWLVPSVRWPGSDRDLPASPRHLVVGPWEAEDLASLEGSGQP